LIELSISRGWISLARGGHQPLREALTKLIDDPRTPPRETLRAIRCLYLVVSGERAGRPTRLTEERDLHTRRDRAAS
jgi:hypothetical protein